MPKVMFYLLKGDYNYSNYDKTPYKVTRLFISLGETLNRALVSRE